MDGELGFMAYGSVQEALRPRRSGVANDTHTMRQSREPADDYEKMRLVVQGSYPKSASETAKPDEQ